jgi:cobalt-precorrin 5A hydrolase
MPDEFIMVDKVGKAELIITDRIVDGDALFLRPKNLFAGIGCNRGTSKEEIEEAVMNILLEENYSINSVCGVATIDLKKDEEGLLEFASDLGLDFEFFTKDELNDTALKHNIEESGVVKAATGAVAVAEPSAILAAKKQFDNAVLIITKQKRGNVTLAIAKAEFTL